VVKCLESGVAQSVYRLRWTIWGYFPRQDKNVFFLRNVRSDPETHPASYEIGSVVSRRG